MCGRFTLYSSPAKIASFFSADSHYPFESSYNIAPSSNIPVVVHVEHERHIIAMRWGLIPSWYQEGHTLTLLNNAKLETIDSKPSFRVPFKRHRCLIIADGFYEWDSTRTPKQPYYFHLKTESPIAMAGIWDRWISPKGSMSTCCIITTSANDRVGKVHERMPVILSPEQYDEWLNPELTEALKVKTIAEDARGGENLLCYPVSVKVNRANYNNAACIERVVLS